MIKNILFFFLLIGICGVAYYLFNKKKYTSEIEGFECSLSDINISGRSANPLINRDSSNVIINPAGSSTAYNVVIQSPQVGCWTSTSSGNNLNNAYIIVSFKNQTRIHYIVTQGIKNFKVYYSQTDNDPGSYEEVLYQEKNSATITSGSMFFTTDSFSNITYFGNLTTIDGQNIFATFIKIVPIAPADIGDIEQTPEPNTTTNSPSMSSIATSIDPTNGVKLEILGLPGESKIMKGGESIKGSSKFYDINNRTIPGGDWYSELGNDDPRLRIAFEENGASIAKTVYSIKFSSGTQSVAREQWIKEFSLTYTHAKSKVSDTIYNIKGNTNCGLNNVFQYYFETPIVATELTIRPTKVEKPGERVCMRIEDIYGSSITEVQEKVLLDKGKQQYCNSDSNEGCGSVSDLLGKQAEIQQLCDAIDLQDQIKENNQRIQKNRQYIIQLEDHDKKIANLESVVEKMKHLRLLREKANDQGILSEKDKQSEIDAKLQQLVQDRKNSQSQFNVKLNIKPGTFGALGSTTGTTKLEPFTNYVPEASASDPFENRWLEHKFKLKMQEKSNQGLTHSTNLEKQFEKISNPGFDYVSYVDNTNLLQKNTQHTPNPKIYDTEDSLYLYQNPKAVSGFYEDVALKSNKADTNLQFIKRLN